MKKILTSLFFILFSIIVIAQSSPKDEAPHMADVMRANGKIYVVVAVVVTILVGLFIYLVSVDRKVTKLERQHKAK